MFLAICLMVSFLSQATPASEPVLTNRVVRAFETSFTEAEGAQWSAVEDLFKVTFTLEERHMFAFYNTQGEQVVIGKYLTAKQLPRAAQKALAEATKGYTVTEIFEINEGVDIKYFVAMDNAGEKKIITSVGGKWSTYKKSTK